MRKGDFGPMMWLVIAVLVIVAVTIVIVSLKGKAGTIIDTIFG